jgi:ribonuclease P protein component
MAYFFALRDAEASARSETTGPRIGLTVPKALGEAVTRNRIKRRLREAVRAALPLLGAPVDVVLHPRRSVLEAEFALIEREVQTIFRSVQAAAERRVSELAGQASEASKQVGEVRTR